MYEWKLHNIVIQKIRVKNNLKMNMSEAAQNGMQSKPDCLKF
jgi:hypothetical protein